MNDAASPASPIDGRYAWVRLGLSTLLGTVGSAGFWAVVVVLPAVQAEFATDRAGVTVSYTLTMAGFALGNVLLGRVVDRFGIVLPLIATSLALAIGFAGAAMATAFWQFALIQGVLIGIGSAGTFGPLLADVSHWFRRRRGIAVALTACGNYFGGALWPLVIRVFLDLDGWRASYLAIGAVCLLVMVPLSLCLRRRAPVAEAGGGAAADAAPLPIALSQRNLMILLAVAGIGCCVAMSMPQVHIVAYSTDLGYGVARGAEMLSLMLAGGAVSRIAFGFLADRMGGVRTLLCGSVMQCAALFFFLPFDGLLALYAVSLAFGLAQGGIVPCYAIIVREYMPWQVAGRRVGFLIMSTIIGMALGGWMSGRIFDLTGSYQAAVVNGIAWNLVNVGIMVLILMRTRGVRHVSPAAG